MRTEIKVGTMKIRDRAYAVELRINGYNGQSAEFIMPDLTTGGRNPFAVRSTTWQGLYDAAMAATKAKRVTIAIPIMKVEHGRFGTRAKFVSGTITGRHAGNGNLMVKWEGMTTPQQEANRYERDFFQPLPEARQAEYLAILADEEAVRKRKETFETHYRLKDVDRTVDEEIERVASDTPAE